MPVLGIFLFIFSNFFFPGGCPHGALKWICVIQVHCGEREVVVESATGDGASGSRPRSGSQPGLTLFVEMG